MTIDRETVIRLAEKAGILCHEDMLRLGVLSQKTLERFAALVLEHERNASADWERRKAEAWAARNVSCGCDHIEYCDQCWPQEFRKGGEFYEYPAHGITNKESSDAE